MNVLKIAFMGTPEFAVASLAALLEAGYDVVAVVTAPDRPAGRGRKLRQSAVKQYALSKELPVLQPTNLKDPEFLDSLVAFGVNLQVVVAFRMLPVAIWSFPEFGTFNLHASLLPDYRGAAPINWAIINGETTTGATTFFINENIDTGNILLQESLEIGPEENAGELHDRLMELGQELLVRTVGLIEQGEVKAKKQNEADPDKKAPKLNRDNSKINWNQPAETLHNLIRGLSPYPGAWTQMWNNNTDGMQCKVFKATLTDRKSGTDPGQLILDHGRLFAATSDFDLELLEIQLEGKRRMQVSDLLNGFELKENAYLL
ncbi:methionyl-tRNA formyltransferase [Robiginitalea myxolifaciens]|uniref:Methionyl-tRNA formyltransferase n=1 Tax=Robiginitalea myxolifaciens TaxID=400055 RepID=A0A1I6H1I6_9FLAO|nr:methionyl-tRNA formyltransferase [Robiginitalea myxolifaciens]SFR48212.1 methionyl-tRNA formyltransferase [Robiginitalea myxolifaciens]